jgi:hypothetical protein
MAGIAAAKVEGVSFGRRLGSKKSRIPKAACRKTVYAVLREAA